MLLCPQTLIFQNLNNGGGRMKHFQNRKPTLTDYQFQIRIILDDPLLSHDEKMLHLIRIRKECQNRSERTRRELEKIIDRELIARQDKLQGVRQAPQ